jgi:hypothetical protein
MNFVEAIIMKKNAETETAFITSIKGMYTSTAK